MANSREVISHPLRKEPSQNSRLLLGVLGISVLGSCATATAVDQGPDADIGAADASTVLPGQPDARTSLTPDAGAPDSGTPADAAGCMATQSANLLVNSNFDGAAGSWVGSPSEVSIVLKSPIPSDSSPNIAWLGGATSSRDILHQDIAIPVGATALVLSGRIQRTTDEIFFGRDDVLRIDITDTSEVVLSALGDWGEGRNTDWEDFSFDLADYAGQTIRVRLDASNDSTFLSNFFIDSMLLTAMICP